MAKKKALFTEEASPERLVELLRSVPTEAFVNMVTKSGLPTDQSRELCAAFKELKS